MIFYLIGMMGSGKSTLGYEVSKMCDLRLVSMDEVIEERSKKSINDIFTLFGEDYFRNLEKELIKEISESSENLIVDCGGGVILSGENIRTMKKTGKIIYIHRDLEDILKTIDFDSRPLIKDHPELLKKIYDDRKEIYHGKNDIIINNKDIKNAVIDLMRFIEVNL